MSILFAIEFIIIGMMLLAGIFSLIMALRQYNVKQNLVFTAISLLLCLYTFGHALRYSAETIHEFIFAERLVQAAIFLTGALFVQYVSLLTRYNNKILKWILILGFILFSLANIFSEFGLDYSEIYSVHQVELPWGEKITSVNAMISPAFWIGDIILIIAIIYIVLATNHLARNGNKNEARYIGFAFLIIIFSILFDDIFIESGKLNFLYTQQFAFISIVFISSMKAMRSILKSYETEKALLASETKYNQLSMVSFDAVCMTKQGIIVEVNDQMIKMFGYDKNELLGRNINDLFTRTTGDNGKVDKGSGTLEKWARRRDNSEFPCEVRMKASKNEDEKFYINVLRDITNKKNYQNELIAARDVAQKSERLKTEFLAQMSHEIRSPINTILSFASLLAEEVAGKIDSELEKSFSSMNNAGKRIIRTIDLMLNMSEIQAGTYEPIINEINLINDILRPIFNDYKKITKDLKLDFEFIDRTNDKGSVVVGDKYTIMQIFENLIDNAVKYTPKGRITIKVEWLETDHLEVQIQDTGIGISEEYKPMIFEKFTQEEQGYTRRYDGNGLGLALVKSYLKLNNAELDFVSEKNVGSIFKIIFK